MSESDFELVEGSGNMFRDLGDLEADLKYAKAVLAARIIVALDLARAFGVKDHRLAYLCCSGGLFAHPKRRPWMLHAGPADEDARGTAP